MESIINFLTAETGIIAAILVVIALIGGLQKVVLPMVAERRSKRASVADLSMSNVKVEDPPPWSVAATANFEIMNPQGGNAVMTDLMLVITGNGQSETPKMVEAAAPIPQFTYKVTLEPGVNEYDVRKKEFGSAEPHSYARGEIEAFTIELRSSEPQWYEFYFLVRWYDLANSGDIRELRSSPLRVEFKPGMEDLLGGG